MRVRDGLDVFRKVEEGITVQRVVSMAAAQHNDLPSMAQQQFKEECDINTIVRRFGLTGRMPVGVRVPSYGDFTGVDDYQTAMNALVAADRAFMQMPADVRSRFQNDPARFVEFCSDEKNLDEMRKLGLAVPRADGEGAAPVNPSSNGENGSGTT